MPGEPIKPTALSLTVRSLLAGAVFLVLLTTGGSSFVESLPVVVGFVVFMFVFGFFFDRWFYRLRMKRWMAKRGH